MLEREVTLIERAKKKDEQAFLTLIQRYMYVIRAVIGKYIYRITGHEEEDIVKMVVLYAWEKIPDLRGGEEAFKCWLGRKTQWICLDLLRKQTKTGEAIPIEALDDYRPEYPQDPGPSTLDLVLTDEREKLFKKAMNSLPDAYKNAVSLRYRGLSYTEIAHAKSIDIKTVGSRLNRGIKRMRTMLEQQGVLD